MAGASYSTGGPGCSLSNTNSFLGAARCVCASKKSGSAGSKKHVVTVGRLCEGENASLTPPTSL